MSPLGSTRIGSALFNADPTRLGDEMRRVEAAGIDFWHLDVFDGHFVPDLAFPVRTIAALRPLSRLPFEIHLAAIDPGSFLKSLADAGADLVYLPAEATPLPYETIYTVRELGMKAGFCLALGTPLTVLEPLLPLLDSVLLLARVTGEGKRGREFNPLALDRARQVRNWIDELGRAVDLQVAGGLERDSCRAAVEAGATSLPLGGLLHREAEPALTLRIVRESLAPVRTGLPAESDTARAPAAPAGPFRVLIASRSFGPNCPESIERMRAFGCDLIPSGMNRAPTEAEMLERVDDVDAIVSGTEPLSARVIAAAPKLKVIAKHGVGYENIDLDAAKAAGIPVCVALGTITDAVADHAMAMLLALARRIVDDVTAVRAGEWPRVVGVELRGTTLGIVGLGQIGKALARRAAGFGMKLIAHDAYQDNEFARAWDVRYLPLDALLAEADFVSLHAAVTPETRGMIGADQLARMKPTACMINAARGELVDEDALYAALAEGRLAGAASDVFHVEPPTGSPLIALPNFLPTGHNAGQTGAGLRRMGDVTAENVLRVLAGEAPLYRVV